MGLLLFTTEDIVFFAKLEMDPGVVNDLRDIGLLGTRTVVFEPVVALVALVVALVVALTVVLESLLILLLILLFGCFDLLTLVPNILYYNQVLFYRYL
jgi:hypothetical protein